MLTRKFVFFANRREYRKKTLKHIKLKPSKSVLNLSKNHWVFIESGIRLVSCYWHCNRLGKRKSKQFF